MVKCDIPIYLTGDGISATKDSPIRTKILKVEKIAAEDLGFESDVDKYQITIEVNGMVYAWTANDTTLRSFINAWGQETDAWIGKEINLWTSRSNVFGKDKNVIYGAPAK